jgi:quinol monooxygenase YgiN
MKTNAQEKLVTCFIDMVFDDKWAYEAVQLLVAAVGCTEAKPGCRECRVVQDAVEPRRVRYSEQWGTEADFKKHLNSNEFKHVLLAMDLCCEEPRVIVGNLTGRKGIDVLRELRDANGADGAEPNGDIL